MLNEPGNVLVVVQPEGPPVSVVYIDLPHHLVVHLWCSWLSLWLLHVAKQLQAHVDRNALEPKRQHNESVLNEVQALQCQDALEVAPSQSHL